MTDVLFLQLFWHIFPATMQDWLIDEQNIDLFDVAAPLDLDVDEIADHFQRYWNVHFKRKDIKDTKDNSYDSKDDDSNDKPGNKKQRTGRGGRYNSGNRGGRRNQQ